MKANEFVREFGWDAAKYKADELKIFKGLGGELSIEDAHLIHLVESWELVESNGGYNSVKAMFEDLHCMDLDGWDNDLELLARAMSDVESCQ